VGAVVDDDNDGAPVARFDDDDVDARAARFDDDDVDAGAVVVAAVTADVRAATANALSATRFRSKGTNPARRHARWFQLASLESAAELEDFFSSVCC